MSEYAGTGGESPVGRRVDPAWVAWAEEQTVKLLAARRQLQDLSGDPQVTEAPDDDPIRVVDEIRLDEAEAEDAAPAAQPGAGSENRPDGRRLVVRVHHENLESSR